MLMLNTQLSAWLAGRLTLQISDLYLYCLSVCLSVFVSPGPDGGSVPAVLLDGSEANELAERTAGPGSVRPVLVILAAG